MLPAVLLSSIDNFIIYNLSDLICDVYFAVSYCVWQKGSNENSNGLLREFYPKGRNLSCVSPKTLKKNLALIYASPRKVLNFHSGWIYGTLNSLSVALSLTNHFFMF
jgi:hypothetical protein